MALFALVPAAGVRADIDPQSGIDLVRIGAAGNAPYQADNPNAFVHNRGSVGYEYSIGRFEVTTAQWTAFFNAAYDRPANDRIPFLTPPDHWGATPTTPNTAGGLRWSVPAGNEMRPVGDISWRMAAIYCNWLCNGKGTDRAAFMSGAYDVSTFGFETGVPNIRFTDQQAHTPSAQYWIPTYDELIKAAYYDPNRNGPNQGGWWQYNTSSDAPPVYGPPGVLVGGQVAEANAGWDDRNYPGLSQYGVPLGAYPNVTSPWGLLDLAGGTTEWTETVETSSSGERTRTFEGSFWGQDAGQALGGDWVRVQGSEFPHVPTLEFGVRIASSIPAPGTSAVGLSLLATTAARRSKRRAERCCATSRFAAVVALLMIACSPTSRADVDPQSGIDFVRIGAVGNAPYHADNPNAFVHNRGSVGYEYSIGRFEVTTAQWTAFFNAAYDRPANDRIPFLTPPDHWGATPTTPTTAGGLRWSVPAGNEMRPVGDISWRMAAIYCNWLCNGKSTDRSAFMSGAYEVSTFVFFGNIFTDQQAHTPGAQYWIPTFDELFKASHYDPDGNGPGQPRWWLYNNSSDAPPVYGPPGVLVNGVPAEANAGWDDRNYPGLSQYTVSLGAYPDVRSPWGLLDVAGGTTEWTETVTVSSTGTRYRVFDGSFWGQDSGQAELIDWLRIKGDEFPHVPTLEFGLRIASSIPAPGTSAAGLCVLAITAARRRRRGRPAPSRREGLGPSAISHKAG